MESTGSFSPAASTSLQSPVIRAEDNNSLEEQNAASSRAPSPAPTEKEIPGFKCSYCACRFVSKRGRGGHERVHSDLPQFGKKRNQKKGQRGLGRAGPPQLRVSSPSRVPVLRSYSRAAPLKSYRTRTHDFLSAARSGAVPLFAGAGGLAPAQPSSAATGGAGHVGISRPVNQEKTVQFYSWFVSVAVPSFVSQAQTGSGLPQPLFAGPAPVAEGNNGGTGDGIHLGGQQAMPGVNQEEEAMDGIDLTLRL
ncbi:unnamed protein product [Alopecurus aequalis]